MHDTDSLTRLAADLGDWARELGFARLGIARAEVGDAAARLAGWLAAGRHGEMDYMARHAALRSQPQALLPGTLTVISVALDYWPEAGLSPALANLANLADQERAYISRYALGRDYHKVMRRRLQKLASRMENAIGPFGYRVFCDSAPVLEVEFARQAGLGWRGKHSLLLSRQGSWRFLGEIYTDLPLPTSAPERDHCGSCTACLAACPTQAIIAPYQVDARRCISYLTIELAGAIPEALRPQIGNRIYGCDDCQLGCPWNRFARLGDPEFAPRQGLDRASLVDLFTWEAREFEDRLAGSPIRRIGHERWLRNLAVALGNGPATPAALAALEQRKGHASPLVQEHVAWALARLAP
ncbi:MAG: tRNA epoxyqueuosine(34) reductase QueG [Azovibrio sp.]|uniref:tRNA epoxyqueuosine(34) reductase QueG n=1 Tax=Azovibrio sp. TaxID=1872673 RepID=UPI003C773ED7